MKLLIINLIVLAVLIIFLEAIFRFFGFGYGNSPLQDNEVLHHVSPKNYSYLIYDENEEYGGHYVSFDKFRRRMNEKSYLKEENNDRIWFFGDSFTEAKEVKWDNSYVGIIDNKTDYEIVNYGTISYSPLIYYILLKNELLNRRIPKIVFIQIYNNDVRDDNLYAKSTIFDSSDRPIICNGGKPNMYKSFLRSFYTVRVARKTQLTMQYMMSKKDKFYKNDNKINGIIEEAPDIKSYGRFGKSVMQINKLLDSLNIEHYFFAIPSKYSCVSGDWETLTFNAKFNIFSQTNGLPYLDLNDSFKNHMKREDLFFNINIHCNEAGNSLIATELLKRIN